MLVKACMSRHCERLQFVFWYQFQDFFRYCLASIVPFPNMLLENLALVILQYNMVVVISEFLSGSIVLQAALRGL